MVEGVRGSFDVARAVFSTARFAMRQRVALLEMTTFDSPSRRKGVCGRVVACVQQVRLWFVYRSTVADAGGTVAGLGAAETLIW